MSVQMISEILESISQISSRKEKVQALRAHGNNKAMMTILKYALDPKITFELPAGDPPYTSCTIPDQYGVLYRESRKLYLFTKQGMPDLPAIKRETLFIDLLESLDPKDAHLILSVKDKKIPYPGITFKLVQEAFPTLFNE
jgi:hypothetical protein